MLTFMTISVLAFTVAVIYHAAHAEVLWPVRKPVGRRPLQPAPLEVETTAELTDYVRRGLEELTVMLAQAARKPHD